MNNLKETFITGSIIAGIVVVIGAVQMTLMALAGLIPLPVLLVGLVTAGISKLVS